MKSRMNAAQVLGDCSERDPPVPIPNTEVKPLSPDGTACASVWESRKSPGLKQKEPPSNRRLFCVIRAKDSISRRSPQWQSGTSDQRNHLLGAMHPGGNLVSTGDEDTRTCGRAVVRPR